MSVDDLLLAELRQLRAAVEALPARLAAELRPPAAKKQLSSGDQRVLDAMLPAIHSAAGSNFWAVADLRQVPSVAEAAHAAGVELDKSFGKLLARAEKAVAIDFLVQRVGDDGRIGALWKCVRL